MYHRNIEIGGPVRPTSSLKCASHLIPVSPIRFLNIRLDGIKVLDEARHPHMVPLHDCSNFEVALIESSDRWR
jgi:hypothetical protein